MFMIYKVINFLTIGFITHVGDSALSGHYMCHILKDNEWFCCNDSSVTPCKDTPFGNGYIYFFKISK